MPSFDARLGFVAGLLRDSQSLGTLPLEENAGGAEVEEHASCFLVVLLKGLEEDEGVCLASRLISDLRSQ